MKFYAGLDVGGTSGRVKFAKADKTVIGEYLGGGCAYNTEGYETGRRKYRALMESALGRYGLESKDCLGVCIAASGIDSAKQAGQVRDIFTEMGFAPESILAVNDCELFLYLSEGPVLVAISGTGSICYGRNSDGKIFRTGGWNHILSDEGSAYDIGLQAVKACADHMDGRISCKLLSDMVKKATGIENLEEADAYVNKHLYDKSPVAALAVTCSEAAKLGDKTADQILKKSAEEIYRLVRDTCRKMETPLKADLWLWGSVNVKNARFREYVTTFVNQNLPGLTVKIPDKTALDVALDTAGKREVSGG